MFAGCQNSVAASDMFAGCQDSVAESRQKTADCAQKQKPARVVSKQRGCAVPHAGGGWGGGLVVAAEGVQRSAVQGQGWERREESPGGQPAGAGRPGGGEGAAVPLAETLGSAVGGHLVPAPGRAGK